MMTRLRGVCELLALRAAVLTEGKMWHSTGIAVQLPDDLVWKHMVP